VERLSNSFGAGKQWRGGKRLGSLLIESTGSRGNGSVLAMIVLGILACFSQCIALTGCSVVRAKLWFPWTSTDR